MWKRHRLPAVVAAIVAFGFAPAPPPRVGVAEAVLNSFGGGGGGVRQTLLAELPGALRLEKVRGLPFVRGEKDPRGWLAGRLRAEEVAPGGPVRVRLGGCRPGEALALLTALVDAYEARHRATIHDVAELFMVAQWQGQAQLQVQGRVQGGFFININAPPAQRADGPAVLQRPKLLSSGTAR
jgi:hypothetical protein